MYHIGDQVVYGIHGVCRIVDEEKSTVDRKTVTFLVLEPVGWLIVLLASLLLCALTLLLMLLYRRYSAERRPLAHD